MCDHNHLRYEDGHLYLVCIDCGQVYGALHNKGGQLDLSAGLITPKWTPDTRHNRWEIPRISKLPSPPVKK